VVKGVLEVDIEALGNWFVNSIEGISICTQCTVLAQSGIIIYLSHRQPAESTAAQAGAIPIPLPRE
jgi:activator of 2-hydroxyglutaryl-CoA dehydratase